MYSSHSALACDALKGALSQALLQKIKISKTHFAATETYKYWSSFDNASVIKLKKVLSL